MAAGPATATACGVPWRAKRLGQMWEKPQDKW